LASEVDEITGIVSSDCMRSLMIELLDNSHSCREFALYWYTSVVNTEAPRAPEIYYKEQTSPDVQRSSHDSYIPTTSDNNNEKNINDKNFKNDEHLNGDENLQ
jgi:hypothetical protein